MECLKIKRLNQQIMVRSRVWNVNKEKLIQALSFQSISSLVNQFLYKNPPLLLVPLLFILFPIFWTFLKADRWNVSLSSAITLSSTRSSIKQHWFWKVLGQSQSWLRTMQTDLWKLYFNSRIFEFATPCPKIKPLRMPKNLILFL